MSQSADTSMSAPERQPAPPSPWQSNAGRIAGAAGMVLLCSSPLTWLLTGELAPMLLKWFFGAALVLTYFATNPDFFARAKTNKATGLWAISGFNTLLVLAVLGAANVLVYRHPIEWDLTQEQLYTLSDQTRQVVGALNTPVEILAFYSSSEPQFTSANDILERYSHLSSQLHYTMFDPQTRPDLVERYQITLRGPRIVITSGAQDARAKDLSEQELTYGIMKVTSQGSKTLYYTTGHGEGAMEDGENSEGFAQLLAALQAEGYQLAPLNLLTEQRSPQQGSVIRLEHEPDRSQLKLPEDAAALLVIGPRKPLLAPEADAIAHYMEQGGRLVLLVEPHVQSGLEGVLAQYNVLLQNDLIVDQNPLSRLLGLGAASPMVQPTDSPHPIIRDLQTAAVMSTVRSMRKGTGGLSSTDVQLLMETGPSAWGETNLGADGSARLDEKDNQPPLTVAMAVERQLDPLPEGQPARLGDRSRLVVFGDSDFANNRFLPMQGNQDLILNAVGWAVELEEKITIRPKARAGSTLFLSGDQLGKLKLLSMDILPMLLIATGLGVVLIRRQR